MTVGILIQKKRPSFSDICERIEDCKFKLIDLKTQVQQKRLEQKIDEYIEKLSLSF